MEQKELNEILASHERWLQGDGGECAILTGVNLRWANLHEANLRGADLTGADLTGADLTGVNLRWANLHEANLRWADLTGANLCGADLTGADLRWANLHEANLSWADLTGANLCGADLTGADLHWANLRWVNFADFIGLSVLSVQVNTSCENRRIAYIPSLDVVTAGCFQGTFEEFEIRVEEEHKDNPFVLSRYRRVIAFLKREAEEDRAREKEMTTVGQDDGQKVQD